MIVVPTMGEERQCNTDLSFLINVAQPSIFIRTPSTFESLILKQIDLYCETIMTYGLHID